MLLAANRGAVTAQSYADNALRNAQVMASMGMVAPVQQRWLDRQRKFLSLQAQASDRAGIFQAISKFWQNTLTSGLLGLGCWLLLREELAGGAGMMIIGSILGGRVLAPLVQMVAQWSSFINVRDAWVRLDQLLAQLPRQPNAMPLPPPRGRLQVEPLLAGVPSGGGPPVLKGVSFTLAPGEVLAVVGPSASGKTTLARLLMGLWPASTGKVRLDGVDIYSWNKAELGPYVGYLPQGVELFEGTLAQNIARFGAVSPQKVEAAARAVGLHEFIVGLPQGYETPLGPEGSGLSGGQRQRVALARALYGDPVFVVLDEPNSSLDETGDAALSEAIFQRKKRGTCFVVMTHRTSILGVTDKMLVLRDGQMQALGPRDEVLATLKNAAASSAAMSRPK